LTGSDINTLLPLIILAGGTIVVMLAIAVKRLHAVSAILTLITLGASFIALMQSFPGLPYHIGTMAIWDNYAIFYIGLILVSSFGVVTISFGYLNRDHERPEEYYILILLATLGTTVLVISNHFITLFLGLEILSVSLYTLIAYSRDELRCIEAGLKYLILAALSSAFLLFGIALIYAQTGTMNFREIGTMASQLSWDSIIMLAGISTIIVGFGFKLAIVPFHMWTPDVYEGAPAPVAGFIATISKGAMFALLFRLFLVTGAHNSYSILVIFVVISIASMFAGNILALLQNNVKRILAYSSIAHLGYLLVAFVAGQDYGIQAASFYLVAYFITTLGAFGVITVLTDERGEPDEIEDYQGLFWRRPWISLILAAMLFSLAGIPLTAGFIGKFYVVTAGVQSTLWLLVVILVINSTIGLFYYLRVIVAMFSKEAAGEKEKAGPAYLPLGGSIVLAVLLILLIWFGIFPADIMIIIRKLVAGLGYAALM
jgi:NADH-quinone oxidoreductase subunit N